MSLKVRILFCLFVAVLVTSCSEKGSGSHFYVKWDGEQYVYHSNQGCSRLDGTFDDFDCFDICEENGKIAKHGFCSRCMDDELIERCEAEIEKECRHYTDVTTGDKLVVYSPKFSRIDLVCGTMPSARDTNVIYCAEAAFTGELLQEFRHRNIAGDHVSDGVLYKGFKCKRNTGAFIYYKGKWEFLYKDYAAEMKKAAGHGGMAFAQEMIIHNGKRVESIRKDGNKNMFRALCEKDGHLFVMDTKAVMPYGEFAKAMLEDGVTEALYLDMGSGWNFSWYRDVDGKVRYIHKHRIIYTTNWITLYK